MIDLVRHLPLSGHLDFILQLHGISSVGYISLLLWLLMMHAMFGMQL